MSKAHKDSVIWWRSLCMEATSWWGGTLGEEAHKIYNGGYGNHMVRLEIILYVVCLDFLHTLVV